MDKINYCLDCRGIFTSVDECSYCKSKSFKELKKDSPVNVIGSKLKGRVLQTKGNMVKILVMDESKNTAIKEYEYSKLRKVL